jgi:hypothetical protein
MNKRIPRKIEIAKNLFWLGGAEEVLSSLEMSCGMGRNIASIVAKRDGQSMRPEGDHLEL